MMESSKDERNAEMDLESQERPMNADNPSSSDVKSEPEESLVRASKRSADKKEKEPKTSAETLQAQVQAEDFWRRLYNTMKNVESKEQAENLFKGLSSSRRVDNIPAKIEAQGESVRSPEESRKVSELGARKKALVAEGFVDVQVDTNTPEMFSYVAKKVDEKSTYVPDENLQKRMRRKRCLCCTTERVWCTLMLLIPILVVFLVMYFVVLTPKDPATSLDGVSVSDFKVINSGPGVVGIETAMNFTVSLRNPNRFAEVVYKRLDVLLTYRRTAVGSVSVGIDGFKQQERNLTVIQAQLPKTTASIRDAADAEVLQSAVANGNVRMELRGIAEGSFKILRIKMGNFDVPVDCLLNIRPETPTERAVLLSASCYNMPR